MLDSCAKHALSSGEGSKGVPSQVEFFPTTSGLELTGVYELRTRNCKLTFSPTH